MGKDYNPSGVIIACHSIMADVLIIVKHLSLPAKRFDSMMSNNFIPRSTKVKTPKVHKKRGQSEVVVVI